jgi:hypothetical protein
MDDKELIVNGERFVVSRRPDMPTVYDFTWQSGTHTPPYGFTSQSSSDSDLTEDQMRASIIEFLSNIDSKTGYL